MPIPNSFKTSTKAAKQEQAEIKAKPVEQQPAAVQQPTAAKSVAKRATGNTSKPSTVQPISAPQLTTASSAAPVSAPEVSQTAPISAPVEQPSINTPQTTPLSTRRSVSDLYSGLANNSPTVGEPALSDSLAATRDQLRSFYDETVAPLYEAYQSALNDYNNGRGFAHNVNDALAQYRDAYNRYTPMVDMYNTLRQADNMSMFNNDNDPDSFSARVTEWSNAFNEGSEYLADLETQLEENNARYEELYRNLREMGDRLSQPGRQYSEEDYNSYLSMQEELVALGQQINSDLSDYQVQGMILSEMASVVNRAQDLWVDRFHPEVLWQAEEVEFDPTTGAATGTKRTFMDLYQHIKDLQSNNAAGQNNREISYYYSLLNQGLAYANLTPEEFTSAQSYFQGELDAAQAEMDAIVNARMGDSVPSDDQYQAFMAQMQRDPEYMAATARYAEAQKWLNQLNQREYELTYEQTVLPDLSDDLQQRVNDYIEYYAQRGSGTFGADEASLEYDRELKADLLSDLQAEGLSEEEAKGVLTYAEHEGNAIRTDDVYHFWYDWSRSLEESFGNGGYEAAMLASDAAAMADAGGVPTAAQKAIEMIREQTGSDDPSVIASTITSWPVAMLSSLASGVGAVDLTIQGLTGLATIDPFTGKYVPVDYNTSWQNPYTVSQAINQAQYQRTFDALYADLGDEEAAAKKAQMYQNWYNLTLSMGQSAAIGALTAIGVPGAMMLLSGSAATSTMQELHDQGYSDGYAIAAGLVSGFAEYITEEVSIESLLKAGRAGLNSPSGLKRLLTAGLNMAYQTISEGSEEGASDIVNTLTDELVLKLFNGGITQIQTEALNKQQSDPSLSWEDAMRQSWNDWAHQFGQDVMYGAISGGLMGAGGFAVGGVVGAARNANLGQDIRQAGGTTVLMDLATNIDQLSAAAAQIDLTRGLDSDIRVGRLANRTMDTVLYDGIRERLTELGEENITPELLRGINEMAADERMLPADKKAVKNSANAQQVAQELAEWYEHRNDAADWTQSLEAQREALGQLVTDANFAQGYNAQRLNALQQRFEQAQRDNPDATVLTPVSEQLVNAGMDPAAANKQGQLMNKILSGEQLTKQELNAFDLSNAAVRTVFSERTGLTGIPKAVPDLLKRSYVNRVTAEVQSVQQMQQELGQSARTMDAVNKENSLKRINALQSSGKKNAFSDIFKSAQAKANELGRAEKAQAAYNAAAEELFAADMNEREVVTKILRQYGVPVRSRSEFMRVAARAQGMTGELTDAQRAALDTMYDTYLQSTGLPEAALRALKNATPATAAQVAKAGQVVFEDSVDRKNLTPIQQASIKVVQRLAKALNLKVYLFATTEVGGNRTAVTSTGELTSDNGWYDKSDGSIHLDINAGNNGEGVILFTLAHELTHRLKKNDPGKYEALKNFLFNEYRKIDQGATLDRLIDAQIQKAAQQGREITRELAEEEVVADSCETMLTDGNVVNIMDDMKKKNRSLFQAISDFLRDCFEKIKGLYSRFAPDSEEGKIVRSMEDAFDQLQKLWYEGVMQPNSTEEYAEKAPKDIDGDPAPIQYSQRSMLQGSSLTYRESDGAVLDRNGKEVTHVTPKMMHGTPLGLLVQDAVRAGNLDEKGAATQYNFLAELMNQIIEKRDAALIWEFAGAQMFSAIRSNSDKQYGKTIDFTTICKKTQQMVDVMSGAMLELGHGLNRQQVEMAYRKVIEAGEPVPCPVCYVFSRWIGIGGILDSINTFQNEYANVSEAELQKFMTDIERKAKEFADDKIKNSKNPEAKRADFYDGDTPKYGKIMSEMKSSPNNKIRSREKAISLSLDNKLQIDALEAEAREAEALGVPFAFRAQNEAAIKNLKKKVLSEKQLAKKEQEIAALREEIRPVEAYQYLNGTIMLQQDGKWVKNKDFKPVPPEILFDLNAGAKFAAEYPYSWRYRTTRGCAAGKAMLPYSDARVGETIQGIRFSDVNDIYTNPEDNPFLNGDMADREDMLQKARKKQRQQNLIGGMRYQSTSDFRFEYGSDYLITFMEMQALGANVQLYTKVIEAVDFLATMGADVNMSVMPLGKGYIDNPDGTKTLVFSPVTGINGDAAIQKAHEYSNAQLILVGISDTHIRTALAGTDVTFVIPFHGSGNSVANIQTLMDALSEDLDVTEAKDYTPVQSDHIDKRLKGEDEKRAKAMRALRIAIITGKAANLTEAQQELLDSNKYLADLWRRFYVEGVDEKTYQCFLGSEQAEQIFPYEYWDKTSTYENADINGDRFQEYCATLGIIPRFSGLDSDGVDIGYGDFTKDKGYWKLLIDRSMYENTYDEKGNWTGYGKYRDQQQIDCSNFDVQTLDPAWAQATYGDVMTAANDPGKTEAIVRSVVDEVNRQMRGGEKVDVMHSSRGGYDLSKPFAEQVDDFVNGKMPEGNSFVVSETPEILRELGFADLPVTYNVGHAQDVLNTWNNLQAQIADPMSDVRLGWREWNHAFGPQILKQLPEALKHPVAVIRSAESPNASVVVITEFTHIGRPIHAAIIVNGFGYDNNREIDSYAIATVYRGSEAANMLDEAIQIENDGKVVGVYYLDNEKAATLLSREPTASTRPITRSVSHPSGEAGSVDGKGGQSGSDSTETHSGLYHKITDPKAEVNPKIRRNTDTKQFRNWFGNSILFNRDGSPKVLYHSTDSNVAQRDGVGFSVSDSNPGRAQAVYARLLKPLRINSQMNATDGKGLAQQILQSSTLNTVSDKAAAQRELEAILQETDPEAADAKMIEFLKSRGYDGLQFRDGQYLLLDQNQIKSVNNIGLYSVNSDSIRHSGRVSSETVDPATVADTFDAWSQGDDTVVHSRRVTNPDVLKFLNGQVERGEVVHTYKTYLELIDDDGTVKLYAPMAVQQRDENGKLTMSNPLSVGEWEESVGNPNSAGIKPDIVQKGANKGQRKIHPVTGNPKWVYELEKEKGMDSTVPAAYNPYQHSSDLVLNDQFEIAYKRPQLVTYECIIPKSELTSGYWFGVTDKAAATRKDGTVVEAKDPVGKHDWHTGVVAGQLKKTKRQVYMTRWLMPIRRLSNAEVAQQYKEILSKESKMLEIPFNVVPPGLQLELERIGVPINYNGSASKISLRNRYGVENHPYGHKILGTEEEAQYLPSSRSVKTIEDAADELDAKFGKGTSKNLAALARKYEQNAIDAQEQLKLQQAQQKMQAKQFKKELLEAKRTAGKLEKASGKALRVVNNELNRAIRENQRREARLKKQMADMSVDNMWKVKLAESNGEQLLKEQQRIFADKLGYTQQQAKEQLQAQKKATREAEKAGMDLALEAERRGKRDTRAALQLAEEAKREGDRRVREAEKAGMDLAMEEHRTAEKKYKFGERFARGWADSREKNARKEERRAARERESILRQALSLPGSAAISERRKFRSKARKVDMINDGSSVYTPLNLPGEKGISIPKDGAEFREKMTNLQSKASDLGSAFYRAMVNDVAEWDSMAKLQTRTDNLSVLINVYRASRATPEMFYTVGMVDKMGNIIGPSMQDLLLCHNEDGTFNQEMQNALQDYMFHKHNVDRMTLEKRAVERVRAFVNNGRQWLENMSNIELGRLAAEGNSVVREYIQLLQWANRVRNKAVMPDADNYAVTAETSQKVVDIYETEMPWLKDKAEEIYNYWDLFMRKWAVGTSISESDYNDLREMYPHYVPTYRALNKNQMKTVRADATGLSTGQVVRSAKGSTLPLLNLEDQFIGSMQRIVRGARLNDLVRTMNEEFLFDDEGVFADYGVYDWEHSDPATRQNFWEDFDEEQNRQRVEKLTIEGKEVYRLSCWVDGVRMSSYVNRAMFEGFQSLIGERGEFLNKVGAIGSKITQPMKNMITGYNPTFALKNLLRDQHTALTNSQAGGIAYWGYLGKAAAMIYNNSDEWVTFQALGGVSANETRVDGGFAKAMAPKTGVGKAWKGFKETIGKPGEISESMSRFAEYLAVLDLNGGDTYENRMNAIRAAAEVTVDFGRAGSIGRVINMWVPYWNANVQGLDKMIRNVMDQPDVKSMLGRTSRAVLVNLIPAALQAALIHALGKWKDYEELSDQQKDNYYCLPIIGKDHKFLKIPKSQDWAAFISTPFLRIMEGVNGRDDPFEGWFESAVMPQLPFDTREIFGVNMPVIMPIFLDDLLDLYSNKNFAGAAIIPYTLKDASPKEQFDADTSLLAYHVWGKIFKGSPMALDYVIDNYMGNFWGVLAKSLPISPLVSRGLVTGETSWEERAADALSTIMSPFVSDNRYSNSTIAAYYDMMSQFEQELKDAAAHGSEKDAEHYDLYKALTMSGGYVDQIRALTNEARGMIRGEEQADIRWEAAGLAALAMEFVQKCLDGEIEDPKLWMTYSPYGETIMAEAEALKKYEDDFNFSGALGQPKIIYDRSGDIDIRFELNTEQQQEYVRLRTEAYRSTLNTVIASSQYQDATPTERAAMLEEAKRKALKTADQNMLAWLKNNGVTGEQIGKVDYTAEQRAAAYSVSWLLGEDNAYRPELTNEFVRLYDYNDTYSFIPAESARKTFKRSGDSGHVYVLSKEQQRKYTEMYHDLIDRAYTRVMDTNEYRSGSDELRAAMLSRARSYVNDDLNAAFSEWLDQTGATPNSVDQASAEISLEAKYAVQRAMGDTHAMQSAVTDELIRLYQYSDVGEVEFFPITTAPKQYVDDRDKSYVWILDADQREVYMSMMFDIYQRNVLAVMNSSAYRSANDYEQAQMLCDVRSRLSGETQAEFKNWLRTTNAPRILRTSPEAQQTEADIAAAAAIVDEILGKARTYKQFNQARGY